MSQTNFTPISIYYSTTASAVPTAANLVQGELAINTADGKLYYEDSSGVVQVLATKSTGSIGGSNTQVQFNNSGSLGGSSGLTWDGSFLTTSSIKNSALTSGRVTYAGASGLLSDNANFVYDSSERLIVGASSAAIGNRMEVVSNTGSQAIGIRGRVSDGAGVISWHPNASATEYARIQSDSNSALIFGTGSSGTEKMRITSAGNVGIGTSSPSANLDIVVATGSAKIKVGDGTISGGAYINLQGASGAKTWFVASNYNVGGALEFTQSTANGGSTIAGTASMLLDSSGNLGLGVTPNSSWLATSKALQVANGVALEGRTNYFPYLVLSSNVYLDTAGDYRYLGTASAARYLQDSGSHAWFRAASGTAGNVASFTQAMTLDASGNLLVGTTDTTKTNTGFRVESGVPNTSRGSTGSFFEFYDTGSGSRIGYISNSGGVATLYNTTSDQRLKTNIVDAQSGNIDDIKVRSFDWLVNGSHQPYGMVAQELIEVAPYAVNKPENPDEMMAVDYSKLVPMMIKEIQDLKQRIATLENK